jgi:hypothetical protein
MKKLLLLILLAPLLTFAQKKETPKKEEPPKQEVVSDSVTLEITEMQERKLIELDNQIALLQSQRKLVFDLVLDANRKKESDLQGKQIKIIKRKE